ncbi:MULTISPECIES: ABC transporter permease [unclassified Novosphingobium]|uniref:ABC transporter permease n=1 Tax=unclassified Novosphingobium TaxID=2644732 RepID=UPI001358CFDF|nr:MULTISPECIES: ABC transporter permease [unclassified Novosphingobium]
MAQVPSVHSAALAGRRRASLGECLAIQARVIGAVIMRELHTRYGRDNIGYLWLIAEPLMLGTIISVLHSGSGEHGINPVAFTVTGYCNFIMFRGIVNRAEGSVHNNLPLLYHRMVTVLDITLGRALLEAAGTIAAFTILLTFCVALDYTDPPARPLYLFIGVGYIFWFSFALSMIIAGETHERSFCERLIHPFSYFMIPLSGAFYMVSWIPQPYRDYLLYNPFPHMFEVIRYGVFMDTNLEYVDFGYVNAVCALLTLWGLTAVRTVKSRIHLS